jgi:glucose-6-phosphate 1-dehydrogenase
LKLEALSDNDWLSDIEKIVIASGKYLAAKATEIRLTNRDGDTLTFGFHNNQIIVSCNGEKQVFDCTPPGNTQAYENVLEALYLGDHSLFIDADLAIEALRIITPALESKTQVPMHKYEPGSDL